jgi:hypothetical protein
MITAATQSTIPPPKPAIVRVMMKPAPLAANPMAFAAIKMAQPTNVHNFKDRGRTRPANQAEAHPRASNSKVAAAPICGMLNRPADCRAPRASG